MKLPTPKQIARAWYGMKHEYGARRNKARPAGKQWEVYVILDPDEPISNETVKVLAAYATADEAERRADGFDDDARAKAVLALFATR